MLDLAANFAPAPTGPMYFRLMGLYAALLAAGFLIKGLGRRGGRRPAGPGGPGIARKFKAFFLFQTLILSAAFWSWPALAVFFLVLFGLSAREIWGLRGMRLSAGFRFRPLPAYGILAALGASLLALAAAGHRLAPSAGGDAAVPRGAPFLALIFLLVAVCDGYSQIWGQVIGGPKIVPRLSPGKTWGGFAGGLVSGALAAWLGTRVVHPFLAAGPALALGAGVGALAFLGDISASWVKRRHGIKDFSNLLGPQGGAMDRADSLIWLGPALALGLSALAAGGAPNP